MTFEIGIVVEYINPGFPFQSTIHWHAGTNVLVHRYVARIPKFHSTIPENSSGIVVSNFNSFGKYCTISILHNLDLLKPTHSYIVIKPIFTMIRARVPYYLEEYGIGSSKSASFQQLSIAEKQVEACATSPGKGAISGEVYRRQFSTSYACLHLQIYSKLIIS